MQKQSLKFTAQQMLYFAILFMTNAIGMILELTASRVMTPYFGNTNTVWTSIIGVILLAGGIGNLIGGSISKKNLPLKHLQCVIAIAAIWLLMLWKFHNMFLDILVKLPYSLSLNSLITAILLFLLPSVSLGCVSPVLTKAICDDNAMTGYISSRIYATAAMGSLIGTLSGGFFIIPFFGNTKIILMLSIALIIVAILLYKPFIIPGTTFVAIALVLSILNVNTNSLYLEFDSQYAHIVIQDGVDENNEPVRYYRTSANYASASFLEESKRADLVTNYLKLYDNAFLYHPDANSILMIGGAAYSYPKHILKNHPNKAIDVVEIDPEAEKLARKYFFLSDIEELYDPDHNRLNCITEDGRIYLQQTQKTYDIIMSDAFSGGAPIRTLSTKEFILLTKEHLNQNGIYALNILGTIGGDHDKFLQSELLTLQSVFTYVYCIPCRPDELGQYQNYMVFATDKKLDEPDFIEYTITDGILLTDDYSPVDQMY